jgi:folylpolyglutamate synthase
VNSLNIIHVAGTKGKGSVCAYTESIIRAHGKKTGFFTSPHLREVRDRIRICGQPISRSLFVKYFCEVWDKLSVDRDHELGYFQFLTILSYHVYKQEGVDVCIYETGIGGECDATNIVSKPVVTGIAKLGIDHLKTLQDGPGPGRALSSLIENIAWHKGGIFKAGSPAFSTIQEPKALRVLQDRASEKGVSLEVVGINPELNVIESVFGAKVQKFNASLAVALANTYLITASQVIGSHNQVSDTVALGIKQCKWEGRFQSFENGLCKWHLDGAHNIDSIKVAAEWFVAKMSRRYII